MHTPSIRTTFLLAALGLLATAAPVSAESAADILETAMEKHEQRLSNVETLRIVQQIAGIEIASDFEKRVVDGHATLVPTGDGSGTDFGSYFARMQEVAEVAQVTGKERVDGVDCWILEVDDLSAFDLEPETGTSEDFEAKHGRFWIDRQDYLMRRMTLDGETVSGTETAPITMEMTLRDYRETDGFAWPYATDMVVRGMPAGMTEEDLERARESLEQMKAQFAEMPEDQRRMMEQMMGGQMQQLEQMVESGEMRMTIRVIELTINGG